MALSVTPAIPASEIVNVIPSVLPAGGTALDLIGIILTTNSRFPVGEVLSFSDQADVADYVGSNDPLASLATIYFNGPNNATVTPASLWIARYPLTAVSAFLRGGNMAGLSVADIQAINGSLSIVIDGTTNSATVNLSAATSLSSAAQIIETQLGLTDSTDASVTASIGGQFTGSTTGTILTVTAVIDGTLQVGDTVTGSGAGNSLNATIVNQLTGGTAGGIGTYTISLPAGPGDLSSTTITATSTTLTVTNVSSGTIKAGDLVTGAGVTAATYISTQLSGTIGEVGLYTIGIAQHVASEAMTIKLPAVYYDSVSGGFVVNSALTGSGSSIAFATGVISSTLKLTAATGAVISQGAVATTPAAFMDNVVEITQNWASFMTDWEPSDANKEAFAVWTNGKRNRYIYEMWDTSALNIANGLGSPTVAYVNANTLSGICMTYEDPSLDSVPGELAAFGMGWTASLDFSRTNGRMTQAFRSQSGLAPQVFTATAADNLMAKGLNFYGDYTTANEAFTFQYPGSISGPFLWKDSYANQIWLNNQLQLAIMVGMTSVGVIPYNFVGASLIEGFCMDPINQAVNFGAIVAGITLSAAQIVEVNTAAGVKIDTVITNRGWYLQVKQASPQTRMVRGSPPCTLWYADGGSIQHINLASIEIQ